MTGIQCFCFVYQQHHKIYLFKEIQPLNVCPFPRGFRCIVYFALMKALSLPREFSQNQISTNRSKLALFYLRVDNLNMWTTKRLNNTSERFPGSHEQTSLTRLQSLDHVNSFDYCRPFAAFLPTFNAVETFQVSEIIELIKR